jgi:hypothetical protein
VKLCSLFYLIRRRKESAIPSMRRHCPCHKRRLIEKIKSIAT